MYVLVVPKRKFFYGFYNTLFVYIGLNIKNISRDKISTNISSYIARRYFYVNHVERISSKKCAKLDFVYVVQYSGLYIQKHIF